MQSTQAQRDVAWYDTLFTTHRTRILAFLRRRLAFDDKDAAQDLLQSTFATAWLKRHQVPDEPVTWLYMTAINHLRNHQRRYGTRRLWHSELREDSWIQPDPSSMVDSHLDLFTAMTHLTRRERELLVMRYIDELSSDQIAAVLQIASVTARKRLSQATSRLRQQLGEPASTVKPKMAAAPAALETDFDSGRLVDAAIRHTQRYWIRKHLENLYPGTDQQTSQRHWLSMSLATFLAGALTGQGPTIDPPSDGGIDAIALDNTTNTLHLVQAHWIDSDRSFSEADIEHAARRLNTSIANASERPECRLPGGRRVQVTMAISAYPPRYSDIAHLAQLYGSALPRPCSANVTLLDSTSIYQRLPRELNSINQMRITFTSRWLEPNDCPWIIVGVVSGDQVAQWQSGLIATAPPYAEVSSRIEFTLRHEPGRFWHLNNGITIRAEMLYRDPESPSTITLEHATLINGSQTFHSIVNVASVDPATAAKAQVAVRILLPNDGD